MSRDCRHCVGIGKCMCHRCGGTGSMENGKDCYHCRGARVITCPACNGTGKVKEES